ncbi:MAG: hypothetical protein M1820_003443 [Bogoriella megaspora]|nr:MAG: hypothetical protein M1820_003443 [Bogoriella megaspora]
MPNSRGAHPSFQNPQWHSQQAQIQPTASRFPNQVSQSHFNGSHRASDFTGSHGSSQGPYDNGMSKSQVEWHSPKVEVAPPVPSFGIQLPAKPLPQGKPTERKSLNQRSKKRRKINQLGLTPHGEVQDDSEDEDIDEEVAFSKLSEPSRVEYNGKTFALGSLAEIKAWISERKKRWPSKTRIAEKAREEDKRRQERKDAVKRLFGGNKEDERRAKGEQQLNPNDRDASETGKLSKSRIRNRRRKINRSSARTREASEDGSKKVSNFVSLSSSADTPKAEDSQTSSDVPDEQSSKVPVPEPPPSSEGGKKGQVCQLWLGNKCKFGAKCKYKHQRTEDDRPKASNQRPHGKVSLRERLLLQQREEDYALALKAIKYLGSQGFFDQTESEKN